MQLKRPTLTASSESSQSGMNEQVQQAVADVIRDSDTKTVEIRPAPSSESGRFRLLVVLGGVVAIGYMLAKSSTKPTETVKTVSEQAATGIKQTGQKTAEKVGKTSEKAGEQLQTAGEKTAEQVEQASKETGEQLQQTGEETAEQVETKSEKAGKQVEDTGEKSAEKADQATNKSD